MQAFVDKFKEEVKEYLQKLESGLLVLEHDPENHQIIDEIFRIMHSMKGSGGMFGFDLISEVTHDLESLYDLFRSRKKQIDPEVISFTLNAIDGISNLMILEPTGTHLLLAKKMVAETQLQITRLNGAEDKLDSKDAIEIISTSTEDTDQNTWYISFIPDENILKNGTNPIYLIDELNALGECNIQVSFDLLPELDALDPESCYVSWYLFIATSENIDTLNDVFIFVNDSAAISIEKISDGNVLQNESILAGFLNVKMNKKTWDPSQYLLKKINYQEEPVPEEIEHAEIKSESSLSLFENKGFAQAKVDTIRVDSRKIDEYMNLVSELITIQSRLEVATSEIKNPELEIISESFGKLSHQLRDNAFDMSLIPIQSVETRFKRLIYDLSKSLNKEVVLETIGMETELDKNIIEKLFEPIMHLVRNSMDHGIENKIDRIANKKDPVGKIFIRASAVGNYVQIEIEDDGCGLDLFKIKQKANSLGLIDHDAIMSDSEIYELIFEPGFSTSELVSEVSGRGVGMDVVKRRISEMRGSIELTTERNRFTRFTLKLPLSISIIDGLLTIIGTNYFVIPTSFICKIFIIKSKLLKKHSQRILEFEGNDIQFINLSEEFCKDINQPEEQFAVVVTYGVELVALIVDDVIREYQAVVKPLSSILKMQEIFSGASILGNGKLALVIDTNKLINKYSG